MNESKALQIFIAHASEDKPKVRELYIRLKKSGFNPWLDEKDLLPGQNWRDEIPNALRKSDFFIACLSSQSVNKRGYIQKEFKQALNLLAEMPKGTIYLIPLKLDNCQIPDLRQNEYGINLRDIQWLNYWEKNAYERLVRSIKYQWEKQSHQAPKNQFSLLLENTYQNHSGNGDNVAGSKNINNFYYQQENSETPSISEEKELCEELERCESRKNILNSHIESLDNRIGKFETALINTYDEEKKASLVALLEHEHKLKAKYDQELQSLKNKITDIRQNFN